jgi:preprotein translocase subunit SecG
MTAMSTGASRVFGRAILPALVLATAGMLIAATNSFGQAAVEQYIPDVNPTGHHHNGSGSGGGRGGSSTTSTTPSTAAGGSSGNGGNGGGSGTGGNAKKAGAGAAAGLSSFSNPGGGGGGSSGGGNAPGTDFPLTTFVFIVAAIFLAGVLVYVLLRRRRPRSA